MKVGEAGEAFFVFETEHDVPEEFQTSPIMSATQEESKANEVRTRTRHCGETVGHAALTDYVALGTTLPGYWRI